jgi:hypothetical protein
MNKSTSVTVSLDEDAMAPSSQLLRSSKAGIRVPTGQLVQTILNAEMSRLSAREIAQRFLKSIMKHVGALSGQNPDDEEDDIIPQQFQSEKRVNPFPSKTTVNQPSHEANPLYP